MLLPDSIKPETLDVLVPQFALGNVLGLEQLASDPTTVTLKVTTQSGVWLLKRHAREQTVNKLQLQCRLLKALKQSGSPWLPEGLTSIDGEQVASIDGHLWTACKFVVSDPPFLWTRPSWEAHHCRQAGAALAQLHNCGIAALKQSSDLQNDLSPSILPSLPELFGNALTNVCSGQTAVHYDHNLRDLEQAAPQLTQRLTKIVRYLESAKQVEQQVTIVHGDYHPGNTLFAGGQLQSIIDFDYAHLEHPYFDLGYAAVMFCTNWNTQQLPMNMDFFWALTDGYFHSPQSTATPDGSLLYAYRQLACFLVMVWALNERSRSIENIETCDRVIFNSQRLLRHR